MTVQYGKVAPDGNGWFCECGDRLHPDKAQCFMCDFENPKFANLREQDNLSGDSLLDMGLDEPDPGTLRLDDSESLEVALRVESIMAVEDRDLTAEEGEHLGKSAGSDYKAADSKLADFRAKIVKAYEFNAHKAIGISWGKYLTDYVGISRQHGYRVLDAERTIQALSEITQNVTSGDNFSFASLPEFQLRKLKPPEAQDAFAERISEGQSPEEAIESVTKGGDSRDDVDASADARPARSESQPPIGMTQGAAASESGQNTTSRIGGTPTSVESAESEDSSEPPPVTTTYRERPVIDAVKDEPKPLVMRPVCRDCGSVNIGKTGIDYETAAPPIPILMEGVPDAHNISWNPRWGVTIQNWWDKEERDEELAVDTARRLVMYRKAYKDYGQAFITWYGTEMKRRNQANGRTEFAADENDSYFSNSELSE